jgi:hypothetical protein
MMILVLFYRSFPRRRESSGPSAISLDPRFRGDERVGYGRAIQSNRIPL